MPPKRRNNATSTLPARKRAKLEEDFASDLEQEDSDGSYHSSGDTSADADSDSDAESSYPEPPQTTTGKKRGKPTTTKPIAKSRATKPIASSTASVRDGRVAVTLEVLLDQPLVIVLEIFSYLAPIDLLHLTRTSKTVRKAFFNPAANRCWNVTWLNAKGLPPCPEDMAIPAFVSLMYESQCFRCGTTRQVRLCILSRARYCKDCLHWLYVHRQFTWDEIESGFRTDPYMLDTVLPVINDDVDEYEYADEWRTNSFKKVKYKCELAFCVRFEDIAEFKYAWKSCPLAERTRFLKDRQAKIKARVKHAKLCYEWITHRSEDVEDQQAIAQAARYEKIVTELRENGWGDVLDDMTADEMEDFRELPDVRKTQKMNKRSLKAMLTRLEPFLRKCKKNHARSAS